MLRIIQLFLIYAFLGWCCEVIFAASTYGKFINRGFLNGPYCPIYGCGVLTVLLVLEPISNRLGMLFFGAMMITSALEWLTGFVSYKILRVRLWDYTEEPFNIGGHICLRFSLLWGIACVLIVRVVHPIIVSMVNHISMILGYILTTVLRVLFLIDVVITLIGALKLPERLKAIDELEDAMREISDKLGLGLSEVACTIKEQNLRNKVLFEENYAKELQQLHEKRQKLFAQRNRIHDHLINAYPTLLRGEKRSIFERIRKSKQRSE